RSGRPKKRQDRRGGEEESRNEAFPCGRIALTKLTCFAQMTARLAAAKPYLANTCRKYIEPGPLTGGAIGAMCLSLRRRAATRWNSLHEPQDHDRPDVEVVPAHVHRRQR